MNPHAVGARWNATGVDNALPSSRSVVCRRDGSCLISTPDATTEGTSLRVRPSGTPVACGGKPCRSAGLTATHWLLNKNW
ncbi:hypothetical protein HW132_34315 [Brasilonema sp. CT11]|nr:hypothetical protein [Brasilonema sp. CT11]